MATTQKGQPKAAQEFKRTPDFTQVVYDNVKNTNLLFFV